MILSLRNSQVLASHSGKYKSAVGWIWYFSGHICDNYLIAECSPKSLFKIKLTTGMPDQTAYVLKSGKKHCAYEIIGEELKGVEQVIGMFLLLCRKISQPTFRIDFGLQSPKLEVYEATAFFEDESLINL